MHYARGVTYCCVFYINLNTIPNHPPNIRTIRSYLPLLVLMLQDNQNIRDVHSYYNPFFHLHFKTRGHGAVSTVTTVFLLRLHVVEVVKFVAVIIPIAIWIFTLYCLKLLSDFKWVECTLFLLCFYDFRNFSICSL